jgi:hypothetical protein
VSSHTKVKNVQDGKKADQLELLCQEFHLSDDQLKNIGMHNSFLKGQCNENDKKRNCYNCQGGNVNVQDI